MFLDAGTPIEFSVAWDENDVQGDVMILSPLGSPAWGCTLAVQPGATTSCIVTTTLPPGTYLWQVRYVHKTCISDYCFELNGTGTSVFGIKPLAPLSPVPVVLPRPAQPPVLPLPPIAEPVFPVDVPPQIVRRESASRLVSRNRFTGERSIKNKRFTRLVYQTMNSMTGKPRLLAIACWTDNDFEAVRGEGHNGNGSLPFGRPDSRDGYTCLALPARPSRS